MPTEPVPSGAGTIDQGLHQRERPPADQANRRRTAACGGASKSAPASTPRMLAPRPDVRRPTPVVGRRATRTSARRPSRRDATSEKPTLCGRSPRPSSSRRTAAPAIRCGRRRGLFEIVAPSCSSWRCNALAHVQVFATSERCGGHPIASIRQLWPRRVACALVMVAKQRLVHLLELLGDEWIGPAKRVRAASVAGRS